MENQNLKSRKNTFFIVRTERNDDAENDYNENQINEQHKKP